MIERDRYRLRRRRRTRRIEQEKRIGSAPVVRRHPICRAAGNEVVAALGVLDLAADGNDSQSRQPERGDLSGGRAAFQLAQRKRSLGAAVPEHVPDLAHPVCHVDRLHDGAAFVDGKPGGQEFRNIRQVDGNDVSRGNPDAAQARGERRHGVPEADIAESLSSGDDCVALAAGGRATLEPGAERLVAPPPEGAEIIGRECVRRRTSHSRNPHPRSRGMKDYMTSSFQSKR